MRVRRTETVRSVLRGLGCASEPDDGQMPPPSLGVDFQCESIAWASCERVYEDRRRRDPKLVQAKRIRNSVRWRRFRKWFKMRHPSCCSPFDHHRPQPTAHVHHIEPLVGRPALAVSDEHCAPLCTTRHAKVGALERRSESTKELFQGGRGQSLECTALVPCAQSLLTRVCGCRWELIGHGEV
jgi:hypothetical protein